MAIDKAIDSAALDAGLLSVANAIRTKGGTSAPLAFPAGFVSAVEAITAGGGGSSGLAYDMGTFTLSIDEASNYFSMNDFSEFYGGVPHGLGETPDFIMVWTDEWAGITTAPYTTVTEVGFIWARGLTGMTGQASSVANVINPVLVRLYTPANGYRVMVGYPNSAAYGLIDERLPTSTHFFGANFGASTYYRAGAVYNYFVSKAWWNVGGVADA